VEHWRAKSDCVGGFKYELSLMIAVPVSIGMRLQMVLAATADSFEPGRHAEW
jgi:hypothetical protein